MPGQLQGVVVPLVADRRDDRERLPARRCRARNTPGGGGYPLPNFDSCASSSCRRLLSRLQYTGVANPPMNSSRLTRRACMALLGAPIVGRAQMSTRSVTPTPRAKLSGLPFHASLTDVAAKSRADVAGHLRRSGDERLHSGGHRMRSAFFDYDNEGGSTSSSFRAPAGEDRRPARPIGCTVTTGTARSQTSPKRAGSPGPDGHAA